MIRREKKQVGRQMLVSAHIDPALLERLCEELKKDIEKQKLELRKTLFVIKGGRQ